MKSNLKQEISLAEGSELQSGKYIINVFSGSFGKDYPAKHTMLDVYENLTT